MTDRDDPLHDSPIATAPKPEEEPSAAEVAAEEPAIPAPAVAVEEDGELAEAIVEETEERAALDLGSIPTPPAPGPANPSPDGSALAFFQRDAAGTLRLWISPLDGTEPEAIDLGFEPVEEVEGPQWSPDGAWLALTGEHPAGGRTAIWLVEVGRDVSRLLVDHVAADRSPRWSTDGTIVAFVSRRGERDAIAVAPADGVGTAVQMTHAPIGQDDRDPCWSTDGTRIAFCRRALEGETVGDHVWTVDLATGETKQVTKKIARRHSLRWAPNRVQIAYVSDDGDWDNIAVVNPDNSAGWNLASEVGDKADPSYSADGGRILYTRRQGGVVRVCDRGVNAANAELLDPGEGVASSPRWVPGEEKRVVYLYAPATGAPRLIVQETKKDAERTELPPLVAWEAGRELLQPTLFEFETAGGLKLGGLFYRQSSWVAPIPGIVYLGDSPHAAVDFRFRAEEQALAAAGFAVLAPSLPGTPGFGRKITNTQRDTTTLEDELSDLADAIAALRGQEGVDPEQIAIVGRGAGGALALLLAGARPGLVRAAVAIDPIADWDVEFDQADDTWRAWHVFHLGLPAASRAKHGLRSPATFVGAVEVPLLLIGTDAVSPGRAAQLDALTATMRELGVAFDQDVALGQTPWATAAHAAGFVRGVVGPNRSDPAAAMRTEGV
ncbi:MAG TPA: alpha/beta fold hydrolase [Thermomicrobiales bacterium]|jgi:dipeptidyl aminopeptidase/acylaminoacyl peptidase